MKRYIVLLVIQFVFWIPARAQNMGVGTTTPTEKLHVAGNIKGDTLKPSALKLTPNAGVGKILTSDASGNASWKTNDVGSAAGNVGFGVWGDCATNGNISEYNPVADDEGQINDNYGSCVSISGDFAFVGAPTDDIGGSVDQGSVSVYRYTPNGWTLMQKLYNSNGASTDEFGTSVCVSGNYAIVGAGSDNAGSSNVNQGTASIYFFDGTEWVFVEKITDPDGLANDHFGANVSISNNFAIVGAPYDDTSFGSDAGSVVIFARNGSDWFYTQKIVLGSPDDKFGSSLCMSGDRFVAGAPGFSSNRGVIWIFKLQGATWVSEDAITVSGNPNNSYFGSSVTISGNFIAAGAHHTLPPGTSDEGRVYIYKYDGVGDWLQIQELRNYINGVSTFNFGLSVSMDGNYLIVGSPWDTAPAYSGSTFIYFRIGQYWQRLQQIQDPGNSTQAGFGFNVRLDGVNKRFLIGAPQSAGGAGKAVFGKVN